VRSLGAACIGVDISPEAVRVASRQFAELGYAEQVGFRCCPAESLPFQGNSFDLVICRLALPYTQNQRVLLEIARVLAHDGLLILQIHHARRYLRNFRQGVASGRILYALYCARVLLAGTLYHITGQQPDRRILKQEVFQTRWMLRRVLSSVGLTIREELERSPRNPWTPTFLIEKHVARRRAHPVPPKLKHSP
jgi:ubiquinone/menaquinone biosynthesis C-methylase UbiE